MNKYLVLLLVTGIIVLLGFFAPDYLPVSDRVARSITGWSWVLCVYSFVKFLTYKGY
ncbi:hypothetical protein [Brochothrix thermosphacta]|uniref:hypothetical protein n=1 Tax=Brochothrix thermosphacta TaxID=2756 RepID=UPI00159F2BE4|nr:hypothetical protein [Brochothrix thermosphacta]